MMQILLGDNREVLKTLSDNSVQCVVTSPPYYGLRDYGVDGQIGLEPTPDEYVAKLVAVFREVRRVLKEDGTFWLNLGDSYNGSGGAGGDYAAGGLKDGQPKYPGRSVNYLKPKDLIGIPWRVAFALQADGWWLRQDIIWSKPNPMPESVTDRCTKAHEYIFLLTKSARYFYDVDAIREPHIWADDPRNDGQRHTYSDSSKHNQVDPDRQRTKTDCVSFHPNGRNRRSVWTVSTTPYKGAHFATFPPKLIEPCILAGSRPGDVVLDPFNGSGTTGQVALQNGRDYIGIELNPDYIELTNKRLSGLNVRLI